MSYILARGDLIIWNSSPVWPTTMPNCHSTILHRCQAPFFITFLVELCNTEIQRCCGLWCSDNEKWYHPILTPMDGSNTVTSRNWHWKSLTLGASISTWFTSGLLLTNSCIFIPCDCDIAPNHIKWAIGLMLAPAECKGIINKLRMMCHSLLTMLGVMKIQFTSLLAKTVWWITEKGTPRSSNKKSQGNVYGKWKYKGSGLK